ncbi:hypothetical protein VNO78_30429 [Psophocarpus tetragonolobus]|uniref:Secreted protein n=1 Tax=Psophocarpus tetragonolobus TaxID=3891 RepID=A0AAN9RWI9_PSOTE
MLLFLHRLEPLLPLALSTLDMSLPSIDLTQTTTQKLTALASRPEVGSSMNIIDGLATSSTAIVSLLRYSVESPVSPGNPTSASLIELSSTSSTTSSINICIS